MYDSLIKTILLETFFSAVLARNIVMLRKARALRRDVKAGNTEKVKARIALLIAIQLFKFTKSSRKSSALWIL